MPATVDAQDCVLAARALRKIPRELKAALRPAVKETVTVPLTASVKSAAGRTGPWSRILAAGTKARAGTDPTIAVGGLRPRLSGGGGPRSVVYGTEFGGGSRVSEIPATPKHRRYRRRSTVQFRRHRHPFIYSTVEDEMPQRLEDFADVVLRIVTEQVD